MNILIIGGGIAGTTLAHVCLQRGLAVHLIDKGVNVSSAVAAGIINPLVFRRMTLSWRAPELIPFAHDFYRSMEQELGAPFFHDLTIRRLFASEQEAGYWTTKQDQADYQPFMNHQTDADRNFSSELNTFGTGRVVASYVDAPEYTRLQSEWLTKAGVREEAELSYTDIDPEKGTWNGQQYDYIIFAEGKDGKRNPWFGSLPLQQTKGELLTVQIPTLSQEESLNRKCFLLPTGNGRFRVGSTYVWDTDNTEITDEGRQTILDNLSSVTNEQAIVVEQVAGVRPTVTDRRPLVGKHPDFPKLVIANGLGTKGYMLAPLLTNELLGHLVEGQDLHPEADTRRFKVFDK